MFTSSESDNAGNLLPEITLNLKSDEPAQYPFYIEKALDGIARKVGNAFQVGNGTLLLEDYVATQVEKLLKLLS